MRGLGLCANWTKTFVSNSFTRTFAIAYNDAVMLEWNGYQTEHGDDDRGTVYASRMRTVLILKFYIVRH